MNPIYVSLLSLEVEPHKQLENHHLSYNVGARIKLVQCYLSLNRYKDILRFQSLIGINLNFNTMGKNKVQTGMGFNP